MLPILRKCLIKLLLDPIVPLIEWLRSVFQLFEKLFAMIISSEFYQLVALRVRDDVRKIGHLEELLVSIFATT